jgi:hypothetical protein
MEMRKCEVLFEKGTVVGMGHAILAIEPQVTEIRNENVNSNELSNPMYLAGECHLLHSKRKYQSQYSIQQKVTRNFGFNG